MMFWFGKLLILHAFVYLILHYYFVFTSVQFIHQYQRISFLDCKSRCDEDANCLSVRYLRKFTLCKMYDILLSKEDSEPGTYWHVKTVVNSNIDFGENEKSHECHKNVCPVPIIDGAEMNGNIFETGAKVEFVCRETRMRQTIQCLSNGSWSANTLFCTSKTYSACGYPGTLLYGQLGTLKEYNSSHGVLNVSCNTGYSLLSKDNILCESATGIWSGLENVCCVKLKVDNWTKIYSSPRSLSTDILGLFRGAEYLGYIDTCETGFCRNNSVFLNWENANIKHINFTVISGGTEVAYMLFDGAETTMESWFSIDNLIQSSWSDLQPSTEVQVFSIAGKTFGHRRWFVAQIANDYTCTDDIGWFLVSWNYNYMCGDSAIHEKQMVYAKNGSASRFVNGEIEVADKFEIWIRN